MKWFRIGLLAAGLHAQDRSVVLMDETVRVDAGRTRTFEFQVAKDNSFAEIEWEVKTPDADVSVNIEKKGSNESLFASGFHSAGSRKIRLPRAGAYVVIVANQRQRLGHAEVGMFIGLDMSAGRPQATTRELTPARRYWTVAVSISVFAMIVAFCAVRLGPAILGRLRD